MYIVSWRRHCIEISFNKLSSSAMNRIVLKIIFTKKNLFLDSEMTHHFKNITCCYSKNAKLIHSRLHHKWSTCSWQSYIKDDFNVKGIRLVLVSIGCWYAIVHSGHISHSCGGDIYYWLYMERGTKRNSDQFILVSPLWRDML